MTVILVRNGMLIIMYISYPEWLEGVVQGYPTHDACENPLRY